MNMRNIVLDTNSLISKEKTLFLEKEDSYYENGKHPIKYTL